MCFVVFQCLSWGLLVAPINYLSQAAKGTKWTKIYAFTSETYTDCGIREIFVTLGKAKEFIRRETRNSCYERYIGEDYLIETCEVEKPLEPKVQIFSCYYFPDNNSWKALEYEERNEFNVPENEPDYFGETEDVN